jgi:hypothetical protein
MEFVEGKPLGDIVRAERAAADRASDRDHAASG